MRIPSIFSKNKTIQSDPNLSNIKEFLKLKKKPSNLNSLKCTTLKFKTSKLVIKSTLTVSKIKLPNHKKHFNKKILKFNNSSKKKHPSDKCLILKPTGTNKKFKLSNKDLNKMNLTLIKNTPNFNKKLLKRINISITSIDF